MSAIKIFEDKKIRALWLDEEEDWCFSVVDVIEAPTDSANPQVYWRVLKKRLKEEGNETVTNCNALKLKAQDGSSKLTNAVRTADLLGLIRPLPEGKAVQNVASQGGQGKARRDRRPRISDF